MDFIALAKKAQKELDGELQRLKEMEESLNARSSAVASQLALADKRHGELNAKQKELQAREEEVSRRELTLRRDADAKADLDRSMELAKQAAEDLRKAKEYRDEAMLNLGDLEKRELALSEREKVYKQEIELEVMRNLTFRK